MLPPRPPANPAWPPGPEPDGRLTGTPPAQTCRQITATPLANLRPVVIPAVQPNPLRDPAGRADSVPRCAGRPKRQFHCPVAIRTPCPVARTGPRGASACRTRQMRATNKSAPHKSRPDMTSRPHPRREGSSLPGKERTVSFTRNDVWIPPQCGKFMALLRPLRHSGRKPRTNEKRRPGVEAAFCRSGSSGNSLRFLRDDKGSGPSRNARAGAGIGSTA